MAETRARIGLQLEKSITPQSLIKTNASNEQEYFPPGASGQILTMVAGVPTWATPIAGNEYQQFANQAGFPATGNTDVIYYSTADNQFYIWTGAAYIPVSTTGTFTVGGNSGPAQTIAPGNLLDILASRGFTTVASATDTITVIPPAGTAAGQVMGWDNTTGTWGPVAAPVAGNTTYAGDTGTPQVITPGSTLTVKGVANSGVSVAAIATNILEISLREQRDTFSPAAAATTVTATQIPLANIKVYRNGILQDLVDDYTRTGSVFTFVRAFGLSGGAAGQEKIVLTFRY